MSATPMYCRSWPTASGWSDPRWRMPSWRDRRWDSLLLVYIFFSNHLLRRRMFVTPWQFQKSWNWFGLQEDEVWGDFLAPCVCVCDRERSCKRYPVIYQKNKSRCQRSRYRPKHDQISPQVQGTVNIPPLILSARGLSLLSLLWYP